jgi:hypothetical protein
MMPRLRRPAPRDESRETIDRAVVMLRRFQRAGERELPITEMLTLLGAAPEAETGPGPAPGRDPLADPLTGCRPVTPG